MKSTSLIAGFLFASGLAVAAWVLYAPAGDTQPTPGAAQYFDQSAALEERIAALEAAVTEERNARQTLEDELLGLYAEIDALGDEDSQADATAEGLARAEDDERESFEQRQARRESAEGRTAMLIEAGFPPERAAWIVKRESELRVEAMQARFEAARAGEAPNFFDPALNPELALREEIGDREYEQYLEANGRPTSVAVNSVLESSAGQVAGLQSGDRIVGYDGRRVFNTFDLNSQTMQGESGESVIVDIVRDGVPMQVVMPRGPIGISTRGWRGRR